MNEDFADAAALAWTMLLLGDPRPAIRDELVARFGLSRIHAEELLIDTADDLRAGRPLVLA